MGGIVVANQPAVHLVDTAGELLTEGLVFVVFRKSLTTAGPTYFMLVDLDNAGSDYKHTDTGEIQLLRIIGAIDKEQANAQWTAEAIVVLAATASNVTYARIGAGTVRADKTDVLVEKTDFAAVPIAIPLKVTGGDFEKIATNTKIVTTDITDASNLENIAGNNRNPAPGDMLIRVERVAGSGNAELSYGLIYRTVA